MLTVVAYTSAFIEKAYIQEARRLAEIFAKDAAERDFNGGPPIEQIRLLKESPLLLLPVLHQYGGIEASWSTILTVVRELARADMAVAHLYGFHCLNIVGIIWKCSAEQLQTLQEETVRSRLFWGNAINYADRRLKGEKQGDSFVLNGAKGFCSGSTVADYLSISWWTEDELLFGAVPISKEGIFVHDDWLGIGQKQTGSGTVEFNNVIVQLEEQFTAKPYGESAYTTLIPLLSKSVMTNLFIGCTVGALGEAKAYTASKTRAYIASGVDKAVDDPWIQRQYGELWTQWAAAEAFGNQALAKIDEIWIKGAALTAEERGEAAVIIGSANIFAGNTALEVTSRIFEVMGARSATTAYGFDRFWRNVRTHTLHDPVEYKLRSTGNWFLSGKYPSTVYS